MPKTKSRSSSRKKLMQWLMRDCKCEEVLAERISKRFARYYTKMVHGAGFPMNSETQAKNIVLAFAAGYISGLNDNE